MKELFLRNRNNMNVLDFALLKTALLSIGALGGMLIPKKQKKRAMTCACVVYSLSFGALLTRIIFLLLGNPGKDIDKT